ncbi:uncharacterized protein F5891DRAFT_1201441 [Suillus fuscotomentosus]|uniref:Uncharacterized protein n=1 Tax=Suillus fuscotomentosus TaxID=1912939 RepID=A0AAD4DNB8_9AGAM|nr:uncharacterized protein F5891DRAFT_1201441 [Suillus fuscotomentosus]KAG1885906.1 hypothetical protein F5891DRAFT_1201441 [Suillus fuscotomentosus]
MNLSSKIKTPHTCTRICIQTRGSTSELMWIGIHARGSTSGFRTHVDFSSVVQYDFGRDMNLSSKIKTPRILVPGFVSRLVDRHPNSCGLASTLVDRHPDSGLMWILAQRKLIKRTIFTDHLKILTDRQDELLQQLVGLTKEGFSKAQGRRALLLGVCHLHLSGSTSCPFVHPCLYTVHVCLTFYTSPHLTSPLTPLTECRKEKPKNKSGADTSLVFTNPEHGATT